jgi:PAS domain S-box-containing protein
MSPKQDNKQGNTNAEAEHDLKNYLDTIIQTSHDGILVIDSEGRFEFGNEAFFRTFGWPEDELIGHHFIKVIPPDFQEFMLERWAEAQAGKGASYETVIVRKDRTRRNLLVSHRHMTIAGERKYCVITKDVTESKQAEETLRTLSLITEQISDAVVITNPNSEITYVNRSFERVCGYSREEIIGRTPGILNAEPDAERIQSDIYKTVSSGGTWRSELLNRRKDGSTFPCEMTIFPLIDEDGAIFAFAGHQRDITDRKETEEALRASRERFRQVAEHAQEWIWEVDANGLYTYASPVVTKILGYSPEEIVGKKYFYDLFHPDHRDETKTAALDFFARREAFRELTNLNVHKNGQAVWLSTSGVPRFDKDGNFVGYRGADIDITERKRTEEALRESAELNRKIISESPIGIAISNEEGQCLATNEAMGRIIGATVEQVLEQNYNNIDSWRESGLLDAAKRAMLQGETQHHVLHLTTTFGKELGLECYIVPFVREGAPCLMFMMTDITERKLVEEELARYRTHLEDMVQVRTRELTEADETLRKVHRRLLNASEDERRHIAAELHDSVGQKLVAMALGIQQTILECEDTAGHEQQVLALQNVGQQCAETIQEIRAICYGLYPPMLELAGLAGSLRRLGRSCGPAMDFQFECDDSLTETRFDPEEEIALFRIAQEAVNNALRHGKGENISIRLEKQDNILSMSVCDDGAGFDTTSQLGQGLGLRSMTERARAVGGSIEIISKPGRTSVTATLSAKPPQAT